MSDSRRLKAFAFAAALAAGALVAPAAGAEPLRVCADPDNLPFSKAKGPERGMYVELAELVGRQLNRPVEFTWWYTYFERRALRNTILQDGCDAVFALPADAEYKVRGLQRSTPFLNVSYALVAAAAFTFKSLDDLKSLRLAVHFGSTPHILLAQLDGFKSSTYRTAEETLEALSKGEVDAAFLWGPVAGYENKMRWNGRWRVMPVTGHDLGGAVAVAVQRGKDALLSDINRALAELEPQIVALTERYGFPREAAVNLSSRMAPSRFGLVVPTSAVVAVDATSADQPPEAAKLRAAATPRVPAAAANGASAAPTPELSEAALAGRVNFNDKCSHCHGTDGFSPVRERDVRYLKVRYRDKWIETAVTTVKNGRPDAGMPTWKDALKEQEIEQILSFLGTIQK